MRREKFIAADGIDFAWGSLFLQYPVQEIQVMTAFFIHEPAGRRSMPPPAPAICAAMREREPFVGSYHYDSAQHSRFHNGNHFPVEC